MRNVRPFWVSVFLLILILVAAILRLWRLDVLPPGLHADEAFNGLDARRVLEGGYLPIYFAANNGREPLFIYLQTLSVWLLGPTPFALRLVSALLGIVTIPVIYFTARTLLGSYPLGRRLGADSAALPYIAALAAAAGMAVSYWHLSISRLGFRTMMLPLVSALAIAFFWRGWMTARTRESVWSGIWFATSFYTYLAARLLPVVVAGSDHAGLAHRGLVSYNPTHGTEVTEHSLGAPSLGTDTPDPGGTRVETMEPAPAPPRTLLRRSL